MRRLTAIVLLQLLTAAAGNVCLDACYEEACTDASIAGFTLGGTCHMMKLIDTSSTFTGQLDGSCQGFDGFCSTLRQLADVPGLLPPEHIEAIEKVCSASFEYTGVCAGHLRESGSTEDTFFLPLDLGSFVAMELFLTSSVEVIDQQIGSALPTECAERYLKYQCQTKYARCIDGAPQKACKSTCDEIWCSCGRLIESTRRMVPSSEDLAVDCDQEISAARPVYTTQPPEWMGTPAFESRCFQDQTTTSSTGSLNLRPQTANPASNKTCTEQRPFPLTHTHTQAALMQRQIAAACRRISATGYARRLPSWSAATACASAGCHVRCQFTLTRSGSKWHSQCVCVGMHFLCI